MLEILTSIGTFEGIGRLGEVSSFAGSEEAATSLFTRLVSIIIGVISVVAGLYFVIQFILGAFSWISSGGDKAKVQEAQRKITNAVIGLAVVLISIFLIDLIGSLLGMNILSPGDFILSIWS